MDILDYRKNLNKRGITLHSRIVGILVDQIETAIEMGEIRCGWHPETRQQLFSIYDFIRLILQMKGERKVWERFTVTEPRVVTFCHNIQFQRSDGRLNRESPATDLVGLLYIAYQSTCDFSHELRSASAAHFATDRANPILLDEDKIDEPIAQTVTDCESVQFPQLAGKTQAEIYQLASDYSQIRSQAEAALPTLIDILDALADPAGLPEATVWYTAKTWLAHNGYTMIGRQQRQFFLAVAECHRFLTVAQPQKRDGVNYYSNQHDLLLRTCANNILKLAFKRTATFI